jgi:hypothetical protein
MRHRQVSIVERLAAVPARQHHGLMGIERVCDVFDRIQPDSRDWLLTRLRAGRQDQNNRQKNIASAARVAPEFAAAAEEDQHGAKSDAARRPNRQHPPRLRQDDGGQHRQRQQAQAAHRTSPGGGCQVYRLPAVRLRVSRAAGDIYGNCSHHLPPEPQPGATLLVLFDHISDQCRVGAETMQERDGKPWGSLLHHVPLLSRSGTSVQSATRARRVSFTARRPRDVTRK